MTPSRILRNRVRRLESQAQGRRMAAAEDARFFALAAELFATMSDEHHRHVIDDLEQFLEWEEHDGRDALMPDRSLLSRVAIMTIEDAVSGEYRGPLALPPDVADFYLSGDPLVTWGATCASCQLLLPYRRHYASGAGMTGRFHPPEGLFDRCPICGSDDILLPYL